MNNELIFHTSGKTFIETEDNCLAFSFIKGMKDDLQFIQQRFFMIGFRLWEAKRRNYYTKLGYNSLEDLAEDLFEIKKTTLYNLISVYNFAKDKGQDHCWIDKKYKDYSQSQLLEISQVKELRFNFENLVTPNDSTRAIAEARKYWNKHYIELFNNNDIKSIQDILDLKEKEQCESVSEVLEKNQVKMEIAEAVPEVQEETASEDQLNQFTYDELIILKNIDKKYKYIHRNSDNILFCFSSKPYKDEFGWCLKPAAKFWCNLEMFTNLFKSIKWEDDEPVEIDKVVNRK